MTLVQPTRQVFSSESFQIRPPGQPGLNRQLRRALADVYLGPLFSGSHEYRHAHRWELLKAVQYKPEWLFNRGVLRILVETFFY